jgi:uncharacterized protein YndB with AHSA1/START domain
VAWQVAEFEIVTDIDRPVSDVYDALRRLDQLPVWTPGVLEMRRIGHDTGPAEVGTTCRFVGSLLGRTFESELRYTEVVPDEVVAFQTTSGPFTLEVRSILESTHAGTQLHTRYAGGSKGFFRIGEPVLVAVSKKQFERALETLKRLLEAVPT